MLTLKGKHSSFVTVSGSLKGNHNGVGNLVKILHGEGLVPMSCADCKFFLLKRTLDFGPMLYSRLERARSDRESSEGIILARG